MALATMPLPAARERLLIHTRAVNRAFQALDRAARHKTIVMAIANPGCSKSYSTKAWRKKNPARHVYLEADVLCGIRPLLLALCEGLGLACGKTSIVMRDALIARLAADPVLLIIDQADMMKVVSLEVLRTIWDRVADTLDTDGDSAFGLAIFGTPELLTRIRRPELERLHRRIDEVIDLPALNETELREALRAKWRLDLDDEALAELHRVSRGSFGWLDRIVPKCLELAKKAGMSAPDARTVRRAEQYLIGVSD